METTAADRSATHSNLELLTLTELEARLLRFRSDERLALAQFLVHLAEVDRRNAFDTAGNGSLWDYVRTKLEFPECQAWLRVNAAKVVRWFPQAIEQIRSGALTLSALAAIKSAVLPHDQPISHEAANAIFEGARALSTRKVNRLLRAQRAPVARPPDGFSAGRVPSATVVTPEQLALRKDAEELVTFTVDEAGKKTFVSILPGKNVLLTGLDPVNDIVPVSTNQKEFRATVVGDQFEVDLSELAFLTGADPTDFFGLISRAVKSEVRRQKKMKGLDPDETIDAMQKEARATAAKEAPVATPAEVSEEEALHRSVLEEVLEKLGRRPIPAALKAAVMRRAKFCCELFDSMGKRCCSTYRCQCDHKKPIFLGGTTDLENLRLLCQRCNLLEARRLLGDEWIDQCIARNRAKRASAAAAATPPRAHEVN